MAFNYLNFQRWSLAFDNGAQAEWQYSSVDDNLATIMIAGYFNPVNGGTASHNMIVNDIIYIVGTDGFLWIGVTAINPDITTAALPANITSGSITTADLADGAVTNPKLAVNAVGTNNVIDGSITDAKLATPGGGGPSYTLAPVAACDYFVGAPNVTYYNGPLNDGVGATITNADVQAPFALDGVTGTVGQRFLFTQLTGAWNGVYSLTDTGSISTNFVLTRTTDFDLASQMLYGVQVSVDPLFAAVTTQANLFSLFQDVVTIGTDNIYFNLYGTYALTPQFYSQGYVLTADTTLSQAQYLQPSLANAVPADNSSTYFYYATTIYPNIATAALDTTLATGTAYWVPLFVPYSPNQGNNPFIFSLGLQLLVPLLGNHIKFAVYGSNNSYFPFGAPVIDTGSISLTAAPHYIASGNLASGLWFIAYTIDGGSPQFFCNNALAGVGSQISLVYDAITSAGTVPSISGYNQAMTYASAWPTLAAAPTNPTSPTLTAGNLLAYMKFA